jgi:hypothetical protein
MVLNLRDLSCALSNGGAGTVMAGVATTDNNHVSRAHEFPPAD